MVLDFESDECYDIRFQKKKVKKVERSEANDPELRSGGKISQMEIIAKLAFQVPSPNTKPLNSGKPFGGKACKKFIFRVNLKNFKIFLNRKKFWQRKF